MFINKDKTIFMTVPAYNDPSLIRTIESAIDNALFPERVFFCIGMQYDEDKMPDISKYLDNPNFNFIFYDVKERPGVYWIRREMAEQHQGQDYFLMIDSHMLFSKYWDAKLINDYEDLRRLHGDRTIISRPTMDGLGEAITSGLINDKSHWIVDWNNQKDSIERTILPWTSQFPWEGERYQYTLYSCSHFFFTNKDYLSDVGFHKTIRSYSEEYTIAISSFLSGWDYYMLPEYVHIGHDDRATAQAIYGKDKHTLGSDGKRYQALFETPEEKLEISKFVLLDNSKMFKVKNQRRSIEEFYQIAGKELSDARDTFIAMLNLN
jgi:Glycosyltransferase (GlcNAc)